MHPPRKRVLLAAGAAGVIGVPLALAGSALASGPGHETIDQIQGAAHVSPLEGEQVTDVPGTVTAVHDNGFWMQDPDGVGNPAISSGLYVYAGDSGVDVAAGDEVTVSGEVAEFRPGDVDNDNLTITQIVDPEVSTEGSGDLPEPVEIGPDGLTPPPDIHTGDPGDVEESDEFSVDSNALDFYESMEGMLVSVCDSVAVGPTNQFGEMPVIPGGEADNRTERGGVKLTETDVNTEIVILNDELAELPEADTGDELPGCVEGVLDYDFGAFKLNVLETPELVDNELERQVTEPQGEDLAVGTYNVENLHPDLGEEVFARHAENIAVNLESPDVVSLVEIQDNTGPEDDGVVAADETLDFLVEEVSKAGGPDYEWRQIDPEDGADGGEPGGNIRVAYLFNPERVDFDDREGGDAVTPVEVVDSDSGAELSFNPGRVSPEDEAWDAARKPLAAEFEFDGEKFFVVNNHFSAKGGDDSLYGRFQPPVAHTETARHQQAELVAEFVAEIDAVEPDANVLVVGDVNDFEFSETADILTRDGLLVNGFDMLEENERYSYVFNGNSQVLDQILASPHLIDNGEYDVVHVNAEFNDQASDHDPSVIRLSL